jgi:F420-dependent oxidoreductase-like protein
MRFGAFVPQGWRLDLAGIDPAKQWPVMKSVATAIEDGGFESAWVYDHFHTVPVATQEDTYDAWALMAALAAVTDRVRLGQMCTCNEYRPPAYLAKAAASIDQISGGRLEMGIGAGWYEAEFLGYGYRFEKPATRIGRLAEAVEIMEALWTDDVVDYEGKHYRLQGAICRPKPVQQPHIPLWIAGGGEQLTLRIVAEHAAYANFGQTIDNFDRKSEVLAGHCAAVSRDFDEIVRSANFNVVIGATEGEVAERLDWYRSHLSPFLAEDRIEQTIRGNFIDAGGVAGTPEQVVAHFEKWRAAGCDYAICYFPDAAYDRTGLELFAEQVIPALRD